MKREIFKIADKLELGKEIIRKYDSLKFDNSIYKRIEDIEKEQDKGVILIPIEGTPLNYYRGGVIASIFKSKGYTPLILSHRNLGRVYQQSPKFHEDNVQKKIREYRMELILEKFNSDYRKTEEFLDKGYESPNLSLEKKKYRDLNIDRVAKATSRKYFRKFNIDLEKSEHKEVYKDFKLAAAKIADVCHKIIEERDVKAVLVHDAVYLNRIYGEVCANADIPSYSYGRGYRDKTLIFGNYENRVPHPQFTRTDTIDEYLDKSLSQNQENKIESIMKGRADGGAVRSDLISKADETVDSNSNRTFAIFTNLMWDGSLETEENLFETPFEWLKSILTYLEDKDVKVILKTHPAEADRITNETVMDWLEENFEELPENLEVLPPDTEVSPYELMENVDKGLVWNSTIGLEMAYNGFPVVVSGDTHYKNLDITFDPKTKDEYFDMLDKNLEMSEEMISRAKRYSYFLFVTKHIEFPFYDEGDGLNKIKNITKEEILGHKELNSAMEKILSNKPVLKNEPN